MWNVILIQTEPCVSTQASEATRALHTPSPLATSSLLLRRTACVQICRRRGRGRENKMPDQSESERGRRVASHTRLTSEQDHITRPAATPAHGAQHLSAARHRLTQNLPALLFTIRRQPGPAVCKGRRLKSGKGERIIAINHQYWEYW